MHSKPRLRIFNPVNVMMEIFDKSVTVLKKNISLECMPEMSNFDCYRWTEPNKTVSHSENVN